MEKRHSNARATVNDLLYPGTFMAKVEADRLLLHLQDYGDDLHFNLDAYLQKMNAFYAKWDLPEKKYLNYNLLGDHFNHLNQLERSYLYYMRAYENAVRLDKKEALGHVTEELTSIALLLHHFDSVTMLSDVLKSYGTDIHPKHLIQVVHNEAMAYYLLNNYERGIDALLQAEHFIEKEDTDTYVGNQLFKAELYLHKKMLGIASRILKNLSYLKAQYDNPTQMLIEAGILQLKCHMNQQDDALSLYHDLQIQLKDMSPLTPHLVKIYDKLAQAALQLESFEQYLSYSKVILDYYLHTQNKVQFSFYFTRFLSVFESQNLNSLASLKTFSEPYLISGFLSKDSGIFKKLLTLCIEYEDMPFAKALL